MDKNDQNRAGAVTGAARKLLAWAPDQLPHTSADGVEVSEDLTVEIAPELVAALQRQADAFGLSLEAYVEAGLTRIMAGAEVLGAAKGQSAVQAFQDLVDADGQPLN
ncbi:hypothetical protein [Deinococcus radiotolerans]|uniref:Uncharacterized protein n=1 Tax=Deinococcus radiotolerans TaxID=1309407 RepID=A0ABQ2FPK4_9DEIO|nr:hypothetical protein [Deinococcus radiotolerans]GGL14170.1 hypothetical protein GCM10010844_36240 [Deinococcus radiotolerans]